MSGLFGVAMGILALSRRRRRRQLSKHKILQEKRQCPCEFVFRFCILKPVSLLQLVIESASKAWENIIPIYFVNTSFIGLVKTF